MAKTLKDLKNELLSDPVTQAFYKEQAPEYEIARAVISARKYAGLTQAGLAARMNTSQPFITRLESGTLMPSMKTLLRVAEATGTHAHFEFAT